MTLTTNEKRTVLAVLEELLQLGDRELNNHFGSIMIDEMHELYGKLKFEDYVKAHGLKSWKDMNDYDYDNYYHDMYDS